MAEEKGNAAAGCIGMIVIAVLLTFLVTCSMDGSSDCYATPGAQEGSAQHERDIARCLD